MKPPIFEYHAPTTIEEALNLAGQLGQDAKFIAGGQSLVPLMNFRLVHPVHLIDLNGIIALDYLKVEGGELCIGAMTRHRQAELSSVVREGWPLVSGCLPYVAHVQIRNRGTLGGSLSHADPAAELPAVMTALDAKLTLRSKSGTRMVAADDFFVSALVTAAKPEELLTEIRIPAQRPGTGWEFDELSRRRGDFAIVGAAGLVRLDEGGKVASARLVFSGVGERPVRARRAEDFLLNKVPDEALLQTAAEESAVDLSPESDLHASAAYRRDVAKVIAQRVLTKAIERARSALQ